MAISTGVHLTKAEELHSDTGQTGGMIRQGAITGNLSDNICASVMIAKPHTSSAVHHHAEQDTIVYGRSGRGTIIFANGQGRKEVGPGDFALIPAYVEHQEVNDGDEDVVWIITRSGGDPKVVNLEGWGKSV